MRRQSRYFCKFAEALLPRGGLFIIFICQYEKYHWLMVSIITFLVEVIVSKKFFLMTKTEIDF